MAGGGGRQIPAGPTCRHASMSNPADRAPSPFTAPERKLIRCGLDRHFGQYPRLGEGLFPRTWRGGVRKGEPKVRPPVRSMPGRGLMEIRPGPLALRAMFTAAGLAARRRLLQNRRAMAPIRFAHLRREPGLDATEMLPSHRGAEV